MIELACLLYDVRSAYWNKGVIDVETYANACSEINDMANGKLNELACILIGKQ